MNTASFAAPSGNENLVKLPVLNKSADLSQFIVDT